MCTEVMIIFNIKILNGNFLLTTLINKLYFNIVNVPFISICMTCMRIIIVLYISLTLDRHRLGELILIST